MGWALSSYSIITRGQSVERISLSEALEAGELDKFIEQAEADGVGPAEEAELEARLGQLIKAPRPKDQTSH